MHVRMHAYGSTDFEFQNMHGGISLEPKPPSYVTTATAASAVVLGDDRCTDAFDFLVLLLHFLGISLRIGVNPGLSILQRIHDLLLLLFIQLFAETLVLTRSLDC